MQVYSYSLAAIPFNQLKDTIRRDIFHRWQPSVVGHYCITCFHRNLYPLLLQPDSDLLGEVLAEIRQRLQASFPLCLVDIRDTLG